MCKSHSSFQPPQPLCAGFARLSNRPHPWGSWRKAIPGLAKAKGGPSPHVCFHLLLSGSQAKEQGTAYCPAACYQKRRFSLRSAWRRALQRGDARFSLGFESQYTKSTPDPSPFGFQTMGAFEGGPESPGCIEVLKILTTLRTPNTGLCCSAKAKGKAGLLLQFRTVLSELPQMAS